MSKKTIKAPSLRPIIVQARHDGQSAGKLGSRAALRERLAIAVKLAKMIERFPEAAETFDAAASLRRIRPTRADGGAYIRILRYVGLNGAASSLARHNKFVERLMKLDRPTSELTKSIIKEGPHKAAGSPRHKLRRRTKA